MSTMKTKGMRHILNFGHLRISIHSQVTHLLCLSDRMGRGGKAAINLTF